MYGIFYNNKIWECGNSEHFEIIAEMDFPELAEIQFNIAEFNEPTVDFEECDERDGYVQDLGEKIVAQMKELGIVRFGLWMDKVEVSSYASELAQKSIRKYLKNNGITAKVELV